MSGKNQERYQRHAGLTPSSPGNDIFRLHDVTLDYTHTPRRAIIADCWNPQGSLTYVSTLGKDLPFTNPLQQYAPEWEIPFQTGTASLWSEYCDRLQQPDVATDQDDIIMRDLIRETIEELASKAVEINPDLFIVGIQAADYGNLSHATPNEIINFSGIAEEGHPIVNRAREVGYRGNVVAVKVNSYKRHQSVQCPFLDTLRNRAALQALYHQSVIIAPDSSTETMERLLQGGPFQSDYRLESEAALVAAGFTLRDSVPRPA